MNKAKTPSKGTREQKTKGSKSKPKITPESTKHTKGRSPKKRN
jgi:hypothetical protein